MTWAFDTVGMAEIKVAIITGAGSGIGEACARKLASAGYESVLMSTSENATEVAESVGGTGIIGSVTSPTDVEALVETTHDVHGRIDVVVNSTGHPATGDLLDITMSGMRDSIYSSVCK